MEKQNEYLLHLICEIERLRKISIDNIKKTDLYDKNDVCKILYWYEQLIDLIERAPPINSVKIIYIKESSAGKLISVSYVYGEGGSVELICE